MVFLGDLAVGFFSVPVLGGFLLRLCFAPHDLDCDLLRVVGLISAGVFWNVSFPNARAGYAPLAIRVQFS